MKLKSAITPAQPSETTEPETTVSYRVERLDSILHNEPLDLSMPEGIELPIEKLDSTEADLIDN